MVDRDDEDDLFQHTAMTFGEHLEELRSALVKAASCLVVGFCIGLWFAADIVQLIQAPLEHALENYYSQEAEEYIDARLPDDLKGNHAIHELVRKDRLIPQEIFLDPAAILKELRAKYPEAVKEAPPENATEPSEISSADLLRVFTWRPLSDDERLKVKAMNVQESFMIYIKAALLAGAILSAPFVFYFLWSFVAAGLYPHEKKYVHVFLPFSVGLFVVGAAMAFTMVFPPVLNFFFSITKSMGQALEPRISEWLSFVLMLPLGFGVAFQLPLVMLFMERIRLFSVQVYIAKWRIAVLLMAIASMVLSPGGDPYSMLMMLVPLVGLYFLGIGLCKWLPSNHQTESVIEREKEYAGAD